MDLSYMLRRAALEYSAHIAVSDGIRAMTFGQVHDRGSRLANVLSGNGLAQGDRVAILLRNRVEYAEIDVGLACGGFVRVALNVRLSVHDFSYCLADCNVRALITDSSFDEAAAELAARHGLVWLRMGTGSTPPGALDYEAALAGASGAPSGHGDLTDAAAWFSYTSGTTGRPKGVVLSHRALGQVIINLALEFGPFSDQASFLFPQPLSHGAGYFQLACLATGTTSYVMESFDPEKCIDLGRRHGIRTLKLVPTMLSALVDLNVPVPFDSVVYGASPIAPGVLDRALDQMGPRLMQAYGQSEAPCTITMLRKHEHLGDNESRFSAGRPWRTVEVAVVDPEGQRLPAGEQGELIVKAPQVMEGYHNLPAETAEVLRDGWLWTKDLARMDDQGFVYLLGRRDQMIITGGFNLAPAEVELVVGQHPLVKECVAFGVPDERWGQAVAVAITSDEAVRPDADAIIEFARERLGFRRPRYVYLIDSIPYSAYGKVDRARLMARIVADSTDAGAQPGAQISDGSGQISDGS
jgi:fatty-acyl-CoA synthase